MTLPNGAYSHSEIEKAILQSWLENKIYKPEYNPATNSVGSIEDMKQDPRESWSLVCAPPNAYGRPHIGNISGYAYMDVVARYNRMLGKKVLVIPGKDHAGLEGEGVFVREVLEKQKRYKFDMSREDFYEELMTWMQENMSSATKDEMEIGLSADFDRDTFTLDPDIVETVLDTFIEMYKDGMIYKGVRIINWDPKARTAVADNQIVYQESKTPFFYFKYNLLDQSKKLWKLNFYNKQILDALLSGTKTVETRVLNPEEPDRYFGNIQEGDYINCVDKATGEAHSFIAKAVRVYTNGVEFFEKEDLQKIWSTNNIPNTYEELIAGYNAIANNYGEKLKKNGIVAIELEKFEEKPNQQIINLKTAFENKEIEWQFERSKTKDGKEDLTFAHGKIADSEFGEIEIMGYGYNENLDSGSTQKGRVIGIQARLDNKFRLIVQSEPIDNTLDIRTLLNKSFLFEMKHYAGAHHILFEDNIEDKFYTNGFVIGTVRPETIFADTAIASDPKDIRYTEFVGKNILVSFLGKVKTLNFIEDYAVDKDFGTGLLKVTPAHSKEDWEISQRHPKHCLPAIQVIGYDLKMNSLAGKYSGIKIKEAREAMIADMKEHGNLVYLDKQYENKIAMSERTNAPIEPLLSSQWYLKYDHIKEAAIQVVLNAHEDTTNLTDSPEEIKQKALEFAHQHAKENADINLQEQSIRIHPNSMVPKYNHWMNNLRDWAISRSLWWGYRLPVWYNGETKEEIGLDGMVREYIKPSTQNSEWVELHYNNPEHMRVQKTSPGENWKQDENVLDTWFSSGQWVFATLKKYDLLDTFLPTNTMVSGFDILENWISRMIMFTYFKEKQIPFKDVYLTGLVRGNDGQKMSKSKGNVLSVDDLRTKYGTDSIRMVYFYQNSAGTDYSMTYEKLETFKRFMNKIWNASKFVLMNLEDFTIPTNLENINLETIIKNTTLPELQTMLQTVLDIKQKVTKNIDDYEFGLATYNLYQSFWHEFADIHIESVKKYINVQTNRETGETISEPLESEKQEAMLALYVSLREYLKMLHPFIPFITERIWQEMPKIDSDSKYLMYTRW